MKLTIFHNPRCKKSRAGLNYLIEKQIDHEVIDYQKIKFTNDSLAHLLMLLNKKPLEMIRAQEDFYKKNLKGKNFTDEEWIRIMVENPKLIQRPIVSNGRKAVFAQPPEKIDELI